MFGFFATYMLNSWVVSVGHVEKIWLWGVCFWLVSIRFIEEPKRTWLKSIKKVSPFNLIRVIELVKLDKQQVAVGVCQRRLMENDDGTTQFLKRV